MLLIVSFMRLPCHLNIPHHPLRLPYHTSFPHHPHIPLAYFTPPLETSPPHVIPLLSPTSSTLEATLLSTTSPTSLPPIYETMIDLVPNLGSCPLRRPRAPHTRRVVLPSAPSATSAPSDPFEMHMPLQIIWSCILHVLKERQSLHHVGLIDVYLYLYILLFVLHCVYICMIWFIYELINCCVLVVISMHLG